MKRNFLFWFVVFLLSSAAGCAKFEDGDRAQAYVQKDIGNSCRVFVFVPGMFPGQSKNFAALIEDCSTGKMSERVKTEVR